MTDRPSSGVLQVFVLRNGELLGTDLFNTRKVVVGRDPTVADLVLESSQVSRRHAVLELNGDKILVRDLGSTNGVFVNGRKVDSSALSRLDELGLGEFSLKVKLLGPRPIAVEDEPTAATTPPPAPGKESEITRSDPPVRQKGPKRGDGAPPPAQKREEAKGLFAAGGIAGSDLSEWDDVLSDEKENERLPRAEFRQGGEADKQRLGRMLEDIGIAGRAPPKKPERSPAPEPAPTPEPRPLAPEPQASALAHDVLDEAWATGPSAQAEEEEEEEAYEPPYSLVEELLHEDTSAHRDGRAVVEVLTLIGDRVEDARLLRSGDAFWVGPRVGFLRRLRARDLPPRVRLLKVRRGEVRIEVHKQMSGSLQRGAQKVPVEPTTGQAQRRRGTYVMNMRHGEVLDIADGPRTYHVRFVTPPAELKDPRPLSDQLLPERRLMLALGGSFAFHLFVILVWAILRIIWPAPSFEPPKAAEEFVDVTLDTPKLEEPPPPAEAPPEPTPTAKKAPPRMEAAPAPKRVKAGGTAKAPAGVLGLLSRKGSSAAPGPAAALAAMSNLSAANVPGENTGYRVSRLIGKLPSSDLSVGGGGGGLMTKGGAELLRGGGGGAGQLSGKGTRAVGGLVQKDPRAMRQVGEGQLDRDEIQKVINENIGQIQRCYERELVKSPGLSGKVQVEWIVSTSGSVRMARQTFSSMNSTAVSNCIMGAIRGWNFPKPRGGEVVVNYPFIFKSIGF